MSERKTKRRWLALQFADQAWRILPAGQRHWAEAMRNELDYLTEDRQALAWASGCLRAGIMERLQSMHVPDSRAVRILISLPLALLTLNDVFATALTAAYRMGALGIARQLGLMTPGDDYKRLIPLMENIPLWLHALPTAAAALYGITIVRLIANVRVSWIPVACAIVLELAAQILGRPVLESIGVRANPNPSEIAVILPLVLPVLLALYLWRMRQSGTAMN
jgi:hypothetical protein